ncbi:MAG: hypothetical protein HY057_11270 [Rhodospirillales bacterium]|nr:hypothetical protein [Rhodospirillales bacterium]
MLFAGAQLTSLNGRKRFVIVIAVDMNNYNLRSAVNALGYVDTSPCDVDCQINSGIVIGSTSTSTTAFDTGIFPAGSNLKLTILPGVYVVGRGGGGGAAPGGGGGGSGGPALKAQAALVIDNQGTVGGGGGGGGGAVSVGGGGGGGAGRIAGGNGATLTVGGSASGPSGNGGDLGQPGQASQDGNNISGGNAGAAVVGNANVTWLATGTRLGPIQP